MDSCVPNWHGSFRSLCTWPKVSFFGYLTMIFPKIVDTISQYQQTRDCQFRSWSLFWALSVLTTTSRNDVEIAENKGNNRAILVYTQDKGTYLSQSMSVSHEIHIETGCFYRNKYFEHSLWLVRVCNPAEFDPWHHIICWNLVDLILSISRGVKTLSA